MKRSHAQAAMHDLGGFPTAIVLGAVCIQWMQRMAWLHVVGLISALAFEGNSTSALFLSFHEVRGASCCCLLSFSVEQGRQT